MSDIKDRLKILLANKGLMTGAEWRRQAEETARRREAGEFEIARVVRGESVTVGGGQFYLVREDFPLDTPHGGTVLGDTLAAIPEHIAFSACDAELDGFDPAAAVFLDTETSGLAGGTGTVAFLVGLGYFTGEVFRLEQCFMRDYDDEEAMLRYLEELFPRFQTVVSYNGKSFDLPLLRTRFVANRLRFRLEHAMHFDLLHACRRFWKLRLQDCSLPNIERNILGVQRHGDVPSEEIPQKWFDYLHTRDARPLSRVFYHHRMDILSLVSLTALLSQCLAMSEGNGFGHAQDRLSLLRLHFRQKRYTEALAHAQHLLETEDAGVIRRECLEMAAFAAKRIRDWERMEQAWTLLLQEFPSDLVARLELAKHHEHRTRNLPEAERICAETVQLLEAGARLTSSSDTEIGYIDVFRRRLERVRRKLAKATEGEGGFEPTSHSEE